MSLAEEMLSTMSVSDNSASYLAEEEAHIVINDSRLAIVPNELKTIAVTGDKDIETITFDCVRYWDGYDLSTFAIYLNYVLPDDTTGTYIPESIVAEDDVYHFDWKIQNNITKKSGHIAFAITAVKTKQNESGQTIVDKQWSSIPNGDCSIAIGIGISNVPSEEESSDVLAQMSAILDQIQSNIDSWIASVVVQTTGQSTTAVMSQKAVTDELANYPKGVANLHGNETAPYNDFNTFPKNIVVASYNGFADIANRPSDFSDVRGVCVTLCGEASTVVVSQILIGASKVYHRIYNGSQWSDWVSSEKVSDFVKQTTGTSTTDVMSQKASTDSFMPIDAKVLMSGTKIATNPPEAPYDDLNTLPENKVVSYFAYAENVANMPQAGVQGTALTYYCGDHTVKCQLYVNRYGKLFTRCKWGSTWSDWITIPTIEQTTGSSTTKTMSQAAITNAINSACGISNTCVSMFGTIGVVGDSFSSGGVTSEDGQKIVNCYPVSWGQIMGRRNGISVTNYSSTGSDISRFLSSSTAYNSWNIQKLESDSASDLYIVVMGINSEKSLQDSSSVVEVGTIADINDTDYTQNADTFYGHYGQMMSRIKAHAPTSKIILVVPIMVQGSEKATAINEIATHYSVPVFTMADDPYYSTDFYTSNKEISHPTAPSYAGMALAFERQISKCIEDNVSYFNTYRPQT